MTGKHHQVGGLPVAGLLRSIAANPGPSPLDWSRIWSHPATGAANASAISTSEALQSLLGAGGRWFESSRPDQLSDLQLAALHHAHDPNDPPAWNQAIPFAIIQKEVRGKAGRPA